MTNIFVMLVMPLNVKRNMSFTKIMQQHDLKLCTSVLLCVVCAINEKLSMDYRAINVVSLFAMIHFFFIIFFLFGSIHSRCLFAGERICCSDKWKIYHKSTMCSRSSRSGSNLGCKWPIGASGTNQLIGKVFLIYALRTYIGRFVFREKYKASCLARSVLTVWPFISL